MRYKSVIIRMLGFTLIVLLLDWCLKHQSITDLDKNDSTFNCINSVVFPCRLSQNWTCLHKLHHNTAEPVMQARLSSTIWVDLMQAYLFLKFPTHIFSIINILQFDTYVRWSLFSILSTSKYALWFYHKFFGFHYHRKLTITYFLNINVL